MAVTKPPHLDSLHILNSYIFTQMDNCFFLYLENIWHINSKANNYITRDKINFCDYHLSSSKQIIWIDGGLVEVKRYGSVLIDLITQNRKQVLIIFTNILHILSIITNLISIQKLDLKSIYWRLNNETLHVIKTHKKVGILRVVRDLYIIVTDL